jgi:hypothetical protein
MAQYIHRCPKCDGVGKPVQVETQPGKTLVRLLCPYCQQKWVSIAPDPVKTPLETPVRRAPILGGIS